MCEQMGWEPRDDEIPIEVDILSYEAQTAVFLFQCLPNKVEGMTGLWLGKDFAGIDTILELYGAKGDKEVFELLLICVQEHHKYYTEQRKAQETKPN